MSRTAQMDAQWLTERTHRATPQKVGNDFLRGSHTLAGVGISYDDVDEDERNDAERRVRRLANQHGCVGRCDRPEHADAVAAMFEVLAVLGLAGPWPATPASRPGPTLVRDDEEDEDGEEGPRKPCTRCGVSKVLTKFAVRATASDGRTSHCKVCRGRNDAKRKADLKAKAAEAAAAREEVAA